MSFPTSTELQQLIDDLTDVRARMLHLATNEEARSRMSSIYIQMAKVMSNCSDSIYELEDIQKRALFIESKSS